MSDIVKKSILNPLATCFVPSSLKAFYKDKTVVHAKTVCKESNLEDNSKSKGTTEKLNGSSNGMELVCLKEEKISGKRLGNMTKKRRLDCNMLYFNIPPIIPNIIWTKPVTCSKGSKWGFLGSFRFPLLQLYINLLFECKSSSSKPSIAAAIENAEQEEECVCPPMFGWVVPPTVFGNPFNLDYSCKDYVHSAQDHCNKTKGLINQPKKNVRTTRKPVDSERNSEYDNLQKYSLEFQMIIRDVCNSVRGDDDLSPISEGNMTEEHEPCDAVAQDKISIWNDVHIKNLSEEPFNDDGSHPLLQSVLSEDSPKEEENVPVAIEAIEHILEKCLTPGQKSDTFDFEVPTTTVVCNPPCSVWCDCLPPAAKVTFKKFLKSRSTWDAKIGLEHPIGRKPLFKRSFSANDAPKYENGSRGCNDFIFEFETRERLMSLRKDPLTYFKNGAKELNEECYRASRQDLFKSQLREGCLSSSDESNSWGLFDAADSLWQPLPDCQPSNDCNQKQNSHRRAREMRRQRSMN